MASADVLQGREKQVTPCTEGFACVSQAVCGPTSYLPVQLASIPQAEKTERLQWVHDMRSAFSPATMLTEDGAINQEFFKPKKVICRSSFVL